MSGVIVRPPPRGWHGGGPDNDMRDFPRGRQTLAGGVVYDLLDPDKLNGNGVLALAGTKDRDVLPSAMKNIPVGRKADRLYFLHNAAWGNPGFTYRVYYKEDLDKWIPGQPDPFVDVVVRPDVDIDDWYFAGMIERGNRQLTGATIAWSGETKASRSQNQRVGVYQLAWDNPHPQKTIAKIDILSPGKVGGGQLFVFAITAATRLDPAKVDAASLLPDGVAAERIAHHVTTRSYGLVVLDNGTPAVLHDAAGNVLFRAEGWYLQEVIAEPGKPHVFNHVGHQIGGPAVKIERLTEKDGTVVLSIKDATSPLTKWSQTLRCGPRSVSIQQQHELTANTLGNTNLFLALLFDKQHVVPNDQMLVPNARPLVVPTKAGTMTIQFDDKFTPGWYEKYSVSADLARWNLFAKQQPTQGDTDGLTIDITVP